MLSKNIIDQKASKQSPFPTKKGSKGNKNTKIIIFHGNPILIIGKKEQTIMLE